MSKPRVLIIRFSSFGDVVQCLSLPEKIKELFPNCEIHWLTRSDMAPLIETHPLVQTVHRLERKKGLWALFQLALFLRQLSFTHIYDAHNNTRSNFVLSVLKPFPWWGPKSLQRSVKRWKRFLLFTFRINTFEMPFSGQRDMLESLVNWGAKNYQTTTPQFFPQHEALLKARTLTSQFSDFIALAPSAAFPLKRWPLQYWKKLIHILPYENFVLLGGPEDVFLQELASHFPNRVLNLAGQCDLMTSSSVITLAKALVANDTGLMHIGEQSGKPTVALMGPAPFGFPSRPKTQILERELPCRPCSKHGQGPCKNKIHQQCLVDISPEEVAKALKGFFP